MCASKMGIQFDVPYIHGQRMSFLPSSGSTKILTHLSVVTVSGPIMSGSSEDLVIIVCSASFVYIQISMCVRKSLGLFPYACHVQFVLFSIKISLVNTGTYNSGMC